MIGTVLVWPALAQTPWPDDVVRFVERRETCDHFRGEEPYDAARREFLAQQTQKFCVGTDRQLADLKKKYRGNTSVTTKLEQYEAEIEPSPPK